MMFQLFGDTKVLKNRELYVRIAEKYYFFAALDVFY